MEVFSNVAVQLLFTVESGRGNTGMWYQLHPSTTTTGAWAVEIAETLYWMAGEN